MLDVHVGQQSTQSSLDVACRKDIQPESQLSEFRMVRNQTFGDRVRAQVVVVRSIAGSDEHDIMLRQSQRGHVAATAD